jgi:membrane protein
VHAVHLRPAPLAQHRVVLVARRARLERARDFFRWLSHGPAHDFGSVRLQADRDSEAGLTGIVPDRWCIIEAVDWPRRNVRAELKETWRVIRHSAWRAVVEMYEGDDMTYAASIGYYALLSLFPVLLIITSILGSVTASDANRMSVMSFVFRYFPRQFDFIVAQLDAFRQTPIRLGIGGGIALVWASLGVFNAISSAVNHAWGVEKTRNFWKHRLFSFLMLVTAGLLLLTALLMATTVQIIEARWFANFQLTAPKLVLLRGLSVRYATLLLPALVFGLIYYFVPNVEVLVKDVWLGALITGLLWDGGLKGFSWFVRDTTRWTHIHGNIATVIVFLIWIYISAVILLWGVEFTAAYGKMRRDIRAAGATTDA